MSTFDNTPVVVKPSATDISLDSVQRFFLWLMMASGWIVVIEPAPYEYLFLVTLALMLPSGLKIHAATVPMVLFLLFYNIGGGFSVLPVTGQPDTKQFIIVSIYMAVTAIFIANVVADDTMKRIAVIKNGYIIAAVIASIIGLIGYFDIGGTAATWAPIQRAQGTFKDPNVMSTFIIAPAIFLIQDFFLGRHRWPIFSAIALLIIIAGLFFAFSRGAWVVAVASGIMLVGLMFVLTPSPRLRSRIVFLCLLGIAGLVGLLFVALSFESVRDLFLIRANFLNAYDSGETGRFGNQLRSLPMLLELPNGFGPLQFGVIFGQAPHNVYVNAFASYGWLGGFSYMLLILATIAIGFKTVFTRTPWQAFAVAVWSVLFFTILQGVQIDTDHWRHFYLLLGLMWGLYAATVRYTRSLDQQSK
ncbi:hypothetical protein MNBD_ALPHA08-1502 [hydrothermal vent metagenome]|uniref:O-antigen ligase-related domain-containing protein n=1 Tax=hydrothermal vent metagenome TaxID=652676 RepID=A0A3B0S4G9_9ZZZZ